MPVSHKKPENGMVKWSWSFSRGALTSSHFRVCYQAQIRDVNARVPLRLAPLLCRIWLLLLIDDHRLFWFLFACSTTVNDFIFLSPPPLCTRFLRYLYILDITG